MTVIVSPLKFNEVVQYSFGFVRSLVQKRPLNLSTDNFMSYESNFRIPLDTFKEWQKAIGNRDLQDNRNTFYAYLNTNTFFACASRLGIEFKTVMHLSSEIQYKDVAFNFTPDTDYRYLARVRDIKPFPGRGRAILEIEIKIFDGDELKIVHVDRMFFKGIPIAIYEKMASDRKPDHKYAGISRRLSELKDDYEIKTEFHVGRKLGVQYGMLSGDLNPIHTMDILSKMFSHPRSFIQGLCSTNLVLSLLKDSKGVDVSHIEVIFASPMYSGNNYYLVVEGDRFEVLDERDQVKVFGTFEDATHLRNLLVQRKAV